MKKMKNILKVAATGSFTLLLAACYGVAYMMEAKRGEVTVLNPYSDPIPDLELTLIKNDFIETNLGTTDRLGQAHWEMDDYSDYKLKIRDIDGTENGGPYAENIINIETNSYSGFYKTINMEEQD